MKLECERQWMPYLFRFFCGLAWFFVLLIFSIGPSYSQEEAILTEDPTAFARRLLSVGPPEGPAVSVYVWADESVLPRGNLLCIHGLGLSGIDYDKFGKSMSQLGIATYAINIRGFGPASDRSKKPRIDLPATVEDIRAVLDFIDARSTRPTFLLGESLGGGLAIETAARYPEKVDGLICSAPTWRFYGERTTKLKGLCTAILGHRIRQKVVANSIVKRATSSDQLRQHWLTNQDHRLDLSPLEAIKVLHFFAKVPRYAKRIERTPVLFIQGMQDNLGDVNRLADLFRRLPTVDKLLVWDCQQEHVIFEEGQFSSANTRLIYQWMSRTGSRSSPGCLVINESHECQTSKFISLLKRAGVDRFVRYIPGEESGFCD